MDLLKPDNKLNIFDKDWKINTRQGVYPPLYVSDDAIITTSLVDKDCEIEGVVKNSVIFPGVKIGKNSKVINSVIMQDTVIEENVIINKAIIADEVVIKKNTVIGDDTEIAVIGHGRIIKSEVIK